MKLSTTQQDALNKLGKYPNDRVMHNGFITGGHGMKFKLRTIESLEKKGLVDRGKITELGKTFCTKQ